MAISDAYQDLLDEVAHLRRMLKIARICAQIGTAVVGGFVVTSLALTLLA